MMPAAQTRDVSRETEVRLAVLARLVARWNPAINLVAPATVADIAQRHIADSLQLVDHAPVPVRHWVDVGSGGGFPGLVVAAALAASWPEARVSLIESDGRKAAFLRTAAQAMGLDVTVHADRAEAVAPLAADVVSARAVAPLPALLPIVARHLARAGVAILPKGARHAAEIAEARRRFRFALDARPSATAAEAAILLISEIAGE